MDYQDGSVYADTSSRRGELVTKWVIPTKFFIKVDSVPLEEWEQRERLLIRFYRPCTLCNRGTITPIPEDEIDEFRKAVSSYVRKSYVKTTFAPYEFVIIREGCARGHIGQIVEVRKDKLKLLLDSEHFNAPFFVHKSWVEHLK